LHTKLLFTVASFLYVLLVKRAILRRRKAGLFFIGKIEKTQKSV